jgi:uroporphyrin-III C-methyltransferase/precorrin-2 dehydrogenase/sirohydrochlorin ferrochelatase
VKSSVFLAGLQLAGLRCLVVGSGHEAAQRTRSLVEAGAVVRVVSAAPPAELAALRSSVAEFHVRGFDDGDLDGVWLAVSTDLDAALAARIHAAAALRRVFFCAIDQPAFCTFSHPALSRTGDVTLAISTNGRAPALARRLREELDRLFAEVDLPAFVERLVQLRERTPPAERRAVLGEAVRRLRLTGRLEIPEEEPAGDPRG